MDISVFEFKLFKHTYVCDAGADPGFSNRGGVKYVAQVAHLPSTLTTGFQGLPVKGPGSSRD